MQINMLRHLTRVSSKWMPLLGQNCAFFASDKKVAVVLSGSGVMDGTEIHEAAAICCHLSREGAEPMCYAPSIRQFDIINHLKGTAEENQKRNVLVESARIARGVIEPLCSLSPDLADAVVFPGGFGTAKNLSTFAVDGQNCKVDHDVSRVLTEFHTAKKPIGMCCLAPMLAAKVLCGITITLGQEDDCSGKWPHKEEIAKVKAMGVTVEFKNVDEITFDEKNLIISTPAFMYAGKYHEIYDGIGQMISKLMSLLNK